MADLLLRLDSISKRYGATLALDNVRFDLRAGEVHALMGENGAGKSTLFRIMCGLTPPSRGAVQVLGADPRTDRAVRVRIDVSHAASRGSTEAKRLAVRFGIWNDDQHAPAARGSFEIMFDEAGAGC